jgi:hypothetical protein
VSARSLRVGSTILAIDAIEILWDSFTIGSHYPSLVTRVGRHLAAGALATGSVALLLFLLAVIPLRRGEKWAFWAYAVVRTTCGLPIATLDALFAPRQILVLTLAPQILGLAAAAVGLALCARGLFGRK